MPLRLDTASDRDEKNAAEDVDADSLQTHNPLAPTARTQAFCDQVIALTETNTRSLTQEEFDQLVAAYDHLEGFERFAAANALARHGINWLSTLASSDDGYEDELNGYDVYTKLRAAASEAARAGEG